MTHRLRILQPSRQRQWFRMDTGELESDSELITALEEQLAQSQCAQSDVICRYTATLPDTATAVTDSNGTVGATTAEYLAAIEAAGCLVSMRETQTSASGSFDISLVAGASSNASVPFDGGTLTHIGSGNLDVRDVGGVTYMQHKAVGNPASFLVYEFDGPVSDIYTRFYDLESKETVTVSASLNGTPVVLLAEYFDLPAQVLQDPSTGALTGSTFTSTPDVDAERSAGLHIPVEIDRLSIQLDQNSPSGRNVLHSAPTWGSTTTTIDVEITSSCAATGITYTDSTGAAQNAPVTEVCKTCCEWMLEQQPAAPTGAVLGDCKTHYLDIAEGENDTIPAGARALSVMVPCDGSATCTGVPGGPITLGVGLGIAESEHSVLAEDVTITATTGAVIASWMEC